MPSPIPVPVRQAAFRLWQQGRQTHEIAASLGLAGSTVRRLLARFRHRGKDGLEPSYHRPTNAPVEPPAAVQAAYIANLKYAAAEMAPHGITLLIEAINTRDMPGFYLNTQAQSYAVMREVGAPNLKMQMDCYHMQIMEGDLAVKLKKYAAHCAHVQVAGVPERHEPDTGEVRYPYLFELMDTLGYDGWVGCEYRPAGKTVDGLGWFRSLAAAK